MIQKLLFMALLIGELSFVHAEILIFNGDAQFYSQVENELESMRDGRRGIVCQELINRLDKSSAWTHIKPLTSDQQTWHHNDRKGTRSHVVAVDTKIRGAARTVPTNAIIYVHPNRIDPAFSLFKLGTFAQLLATAMDLNFGSFSSDFKISQKRAFFFRNAWRDAMRLETIPLADRVPTLEYQNAKKENLIRAENSALFPILDVFPQHQINPNLEDPPDLKPMP